MSAIRSLPARRTLTAYTQSAVRPLTQFNTVARRQYVTPRLHEDTEEDGRKKQQKGMSALIIVLPAIVFGGLYLIQNGQKDVAHNDHQGQKSIHTSNEAMIKGARPEVEDSKIDVSDSDMPDDAPNRPDNLDKMQRKMDAKPPTKMISRSNLD